MRVRFHIAVVVAAGSGCATGPDLPYCAPVSQLPSPIPLECQVRADVVAYAEEMFRLVDDEVGPIPIRVAFGPDSRVASVCTERSSAPNAWKARTQVASRVDDLMSLPAGPACIANARLDVNEGGAVRAEVGRLIEECGRETPAAPVFDDPNPHERSLHGYGACIEHQQAKRGEVWFMGGQSREDISVFTETDVASPRHEALQECSELFVPARDNLFGIPAGIASADQRLVECMRDLGWEQVY